MKKASILIMLYVLLIIALAGCGGGSGGGNPKETPTPETAIIENVGDGGVGVGFGDNPYANGTEILRYQTFIANEYVNLTQIEIKLRRFNNVGSPDDVKVQLFRTDTNHQPTGTPLATAFISAASITNYNPQAFQLVSVNLPYSGLVNGKEYAIVLSQNFPASDPVTLPHYEVCAAIKNQPSWHFGKYKKQPLGQTPEYLWADETSNIGPAWIRIHVSRLTPTPATGTLCMSGKMDKGGLTVRKETKVAQVFTASAYSQITSVDLELAKTGNPADLVVSLHGVDASDKPTGSALAEKTVSTDYIGNYPAYTQINAPLTYSGLVDGNRYAIVLSTPLSNASPATDQYWAACFYDYPLNNSKGLVEQGYGWLTNTYLRCKMVIHVAK